MIKSILSVGSLLAMVALAAETGGDQPTESPHPGTEPAPPTAPAKKSIVPAKYAGKYKNGGDDALATFIKAQSTEGTEFKFDRFFELCTKNGLDATKVEHYKQQVADKRHGAQGRARMTLRNMLATIARKNGKLVGLDGEETAIDLPKPALTGAAKAAAEAKPADATSTAPEAPAAA